MGELVAKDEIISVVVYEGIDNRIVERTYYSKHGKLKDVKETKNEQNA